MYCVTNLVTNESVLIRLFGGKLSQTSYEFKVLNNITESLLYFELGRRNLGPKLLAVFDGGRVEEFIKSRTLTNRDLRDKKIRADIARKLARVHAIKSFPIDKKPINVINEIKKLIDNYHANCGRDKLRDYVIANNLNGFSATIERIIDFDFDAAIHWLIRNEPKVVN